jgi:hypothetical protein
MATFPALNPNARTFIPGQKAATPIGTLDGDELSVLHTNASTFWTLRLTFTGITADQHFSLVSHYMNHGRYIYFDLPEQILRGSNIQLPPNYEWTYAASPNTDYSPGVITVTVELNAQPREGYVDVVGCPTTENSSAGGAGTFTRVIDVGPGLGTFDFTYTAYTVPDRFIISGAASYDTGFVSGTATISVTKSTPDRFITLTIEAPTAGTAWQYSIGCVS